MKCASCGTENPAGQKFCGECAAPLSDPGACRTPVVRETTDAQVAESLVPRGVARGELKLVTVLFADVSGFTGLSENLDPGSLRDLIATCFDRLVPCIERYGGTVDKFVGDEIMALFGAPVAHENDPERALPRRPRDAPRPRGVQRGASGRPWPSTSA